MKVIFFILLFTSFFYGEFIKSNNILQDTKTNLMWQDNIEATYKDDITLANVYCDELILNGYIDWRLPTIKELQTIIDQNGEKHYLNKKFFFVKEGKYWSYTPNVMDKKRYWTVDFASGKVSSEDMDDLNYIRCVRRQK